MRTLVRPLLLLAALAVATPVPAQTTAPTPVEVERVKPKKPKLETLRFLQANRDFIRARFDRLREKPGNGEAAPTAIDPRFLDYPSMLAAIHASADSVALADQERQKQALFASITDLGTLEARLDLLERQLAEQRDRLGVLQRNFTGLQKTEMLVVLTGAAPEAGLERVQLTLEGGDTLSVPLSAPERTALATGGAVELFHGFVEPREQVVEIRLLGEHWPQGDAGYITLEPARDRLTMLRLDLSHLAATAGASSLDARTWLHDESTP